MEIMETIRDQVENNAVLLYMKGSPNQPQCGFSARTVDALKACDTEFHSVDVYAEPDIRQVLPQYSEWPTFPQLFINGELIGGCDIVMSMFQNGDLKQSLADAVGT